jgi:hypothetical protein
VRTQDGCAGHAGWGAEVRGIAVAVLDRLEPALDQVRAGADVGAGAGPDMSTDTCGICPVCAVLAAVRREHPELAVRVAEQVASMVAVLRAALDEGDPVAADRAAADRAASGARAQQGAAEQGAAEQAGAAATGGRGADRAAAGSDAPPARKVQRIPVDRVRR